MTDKRINFHASHEKVRLAIIKLLRKKPLQAKKLREELTKSGKAYEFSKDRLNDFLKQLSDEGEIVRIMLNDSQYPAYAVTNKSKILAEFQGHFFQTNLKTNLFLNPEALLTEFKKEKSIVDPILKFFGFYVLSSLLMSHGLDKEVMTDKQLTPKQFEELRQVWLKSVLDLQRGKSFSDFFDEHFDTKKGDLEILIKALEKNYKKNMIIFNKVFENSLQNNPKIKQLSDETFDKSVIDNMEILRK